MSEFKKDFDELIVLGNSPDLTRYQEYHDKMKDFFEKYEPKQLVEVPQVIADFIEDNKESVKLYGALNEISELGHEELYKWVFQQMEGQELFARAWIEGYTVKKEEVFYLKNKLTGLYLYRSDKSILAEQSYCEDIKGNPLDYCIFTQEEIDKMHTGSYEQIEVKVDEVEE